MFEAIKNHPEEWWHFAGVYEDVEVPDWSLITFSMCSFDDNKLKFQISLKSVMLEGVKNPLEEEWHSVGV